jgi:hypothetical protein
MINGRLSPDIPTGVYALSVRRDFDGGQGTLLNAFTVHPRFNPTHTLDSDVAYIATFGRAAPSAEGDDDRVQVIFLEVPDTAPDDLYIRIFDADTGGGGEGDDTDVVGSSPFDTMMTYTLLGGAGAYTVPAARADHPDAAGINSGTVITQQVVGPDGTRDDAWLPLPVNRSQGELVGSRYVFKLVVQGAGGDDGNWYQVAISTDPNNNLEVLGARVFAFSWCVMLPNQGDEVAVYPFVPAGTTISTLTQYNFDFDFEAGLGAAITLISPLRTRPVVSLSANGTTASQTFDVFLEEQATTWTARYLSWRAEDKPNHFSIWFLSETGAALPIYAAPTLDPPP